MEMNNFFLNLVVWETTTYSKLRDSKRNVAFPCKVPKVMFILRTAGQPIVLRFLLILNYFKIVKVFQIFLYVIYSRILKHRTPELCQKESSPLFLLVNNCKQRLPSNHSFQQIRFSLSLADKHFSPCRTAYQA